MRIMVLFTSMFVACSLGEAGDDKPKPRPLPVLAAPADYDPQMFLGRVDSLCADAVVIKPQGDMRERWIARHPDGTPRAEYVFVQDNTQPARTCLAPPPDTK